MKNIQIKRWDNQEVIHSGNFESVKHCLEDGVKNGVSFTYADLSKSNLIHANLSKVNLSKANLYKANLIHANLNKSNLRAAYLSKANLIHANLNKSSLSKADLGYADLGYADLSKADLGYADLINIDLYGTNLTEITTCHKHYFNNSDYKYTIFISKYFSQIGCFNFSNEKWRSLTESDILGLGSKTLLTFYPILIKLLDDFDNDIIRVRRKKSDSKDFCFIGITY